MDQKIADSLSACVYAFFSVDRLGDLCYGRYGSYGTLAEDSIRRCSSGRWSGDFLFEELFPLSAHRSSGIVPVVERGADQNGKKFGWENGSGVIVDRLIYTEFGLFDQ